MLGRLKMELEQCEPFHERVNHFNRCLSALAKHNVHALEERLEILRFKGRRPWLFEQSLYNSVESIDEVFLVHLERSGSCLEDLESAEQSS